MGTSFRQEIDMMIIKTENNAIYFFITASKKIENSKPACL
jgi:hypothetical protein